jgi:hypothetical protein
MLPVSKLSTTVLVLGICACASRNRVSTDHPSLAGPVVPGTYAVLICNGPRTCTAQDAESVYANGTIVILDRETTSLADTLHRLYPYTELEPSAFVHVQVCYLFRRNLLIKPRQGGPQSSGFSDLVVAPGSDSVSFSLGSYVDAGYTARVVMRNGVMTGNAIGWNSNQLFADDTVNGQHILRRRPDKELVGILGPADSIIGTRVGGPRESVCLAGRES